MKPALWWCAAHGHIHGNAICPVAVTRSRSARKRFAIAHPPLVRERIDVLIEHMTCKEGVVNRAAITARPPRRLAAPTRACNRPLALGA
jgi:hypothetical protein